MKVCLISLGCDKNLVDSQQMAALFSSHGYSLTDDESDADIIVINSCCFIHDAKKESIDSIIECGALKEEGKLKYLIVAGCLAERYSDEIVKELPEVDAVVGTASFDEIVNVADDLVKRGSGKEKELAPVIRKRDVSTPVFPEVRRSPGAPGYYGFLKIAEGCEKNCTYCIIPRIRGKYRSVPMELLIKDAEALAEQGVKELILVAQETTLYGTDLYGHKALPELLKGLSAIEDLKWIRLMYCYPEEIDDELIFSIKTLPKVCHYLDMPVQHCSDRILKKMGRRTSRKDLEHLIGKLKKEIPDIALRTTLITGFPGETEEEHNELLSFVEEMKFDRLGVFTYSPEEGTAAASFPDQCPEEVKIQRCDEIMALQKEVSLEIQGSYPGREIECITEGRIPEENVLIARTYRDAPDVDGYIFIEEGPETDGIMSGDIIKAKVTAFSEYDLNGVCIKDEPSE